MILRSLAATAAIMVVLAPASARADYSSDVTGSTVFMTGNGDEDLLVIDASGGFLRHNRFAAGDPGFASAGDFDSSAGVETAINQQGVNLIVTAGAGDDHVQIGRPTGPAGDVAVAVTADGGAQASAFPGDSLIVLDGGDAPSRTVDVGATQVSGVGGTVSHQAFERLSVTTAGGNDVIAVAADAPRTTIHSGRGADRIALAEGARPAISGGPGGDTLDYSSWTTPVRFTAPREASLLAVMDGTQNVPASETDGVGFANLQLDLETNRFDLNTRVDGTPRAEVTGSGIHAAPAGQEGPAFFEIGGGTMWTDEYNPFLGPYIARTITGATFPAARVDDLLAGNVYFDVRTIAFPAGEIRGQFEPAPDDPLLEVTIGVKQPGRFGLENVIGGSAGDVIKGDGLANRLEGGPGGDKLSGGDGDDLLVGGAGLDLLTGGEGRDRLFGEGGIDDLRARDGVAEPKINCGAGSNARETARVDRNDPPAVSC